MVPADGWNGPGGNPFEAVVEDATLYGRGACDMKGSLACMLSAAASIDVANQVAPVWIVCTADEEVGLQGARRMVGQSDAYRELVANNPVSLIGEPTRLRVVHAHKGLAGFRIESRGEAAHSSTGKGLNANLAMVPMLQKLVEISERCQSDSSLHDSCFDPPTLSFNFGVSDHMNTVNIVPSRSTAWGCFRTMPEIDAGDLLQEIAEKADELGLEFQSITGGEPLTTSIESPAVKAMCQITQPVCGQSSPQTECYATDGSMLGELEDRIVCGPGDIAQAHTTAEFITLEQLIAGADVYRQAIQQWCC